MTTLAFLYCLRCCAYRRVFTTPEVCPVCGTPIAPANREAEDRAADARDRAAIEGFLKDVLRK